MRIKNTLWAMIMLSVLGSCDKQARHGVENDRPAGVRFTALIEGGTISRAGGAAWEANDQIGVYMKKKGQPLSPGVIVGGVENLSFTTRLGDGNFLPAGTAPEYPSDGSAVDFIAYYPYKPALNSYIYKVDLTDQSKPAAIDLLYADNLTGRTKTSATGNLQFYHQLSKLILNLSSSDNSDFSALAVSISGVHTKGDFHLANGQLTIDQTSGGTLQMHRAGNAAEAILLPARTVGGIKISLTLNGKTKEMSLPASITSLQKGSQYVVSIDIRNGGSQVEPEEAKYAKWRETPVITKKLLDQSNIHYINHYMPNDKKVRNYSLLYDSDLKLAHWVAYPYCSYYGGSVDRTNAWQYDPGISQALQVNLKKSYGVNGYARGHQIASADRRRDDESNASTFYYTNMTPQVQNGLNGGIWANLEDKVRKWTTDTIFVVTGTAVTTATDKVIQYFTNSGDGLKVAVPKYYYKALARKVGGVFRTIAFKMENRAYANSGAYMECALSVSELEKETGFTFFPSISADVKAVLDKSQWQ